MALFSRFNPTSHLSPRRRGKPQWRRFEPLESRCLLAVQPVSTFTFGGVQGDAAWDITVDQQGHYYVAGRFRDTVDFAPSEDLSALGNPDLRSAENNSPALFVAHYNDEGDFQWVSVFSNVPGPSSGFRSITHDRDGNLYLSGRFQDPIQFGSTTLTPRQGPDESGVYPNSYDSFLVKLDSLGQPIWAVADYGELSGETVVDDVDPNRDNWSLYTSSADTLNPESVSIYNPVFNGLVRRRSAGDAHAMWTASVNNGAIGEISWPGTGRNVAPDIALGGANNDQLYMAGSFVGTTQLGATTLSSKHQGSTRSDAYLARLDTSGNFLWAKGVGGGSYETGGAVATANGQVFLMGVFLGSFSLAGTQLSAPSDTSDAYVAQFDTSGNVLWARQLGEALTPFQNIACDLAASNGSVLAAIQNNSYFWELQASSGLQLGAWRVADPSVGQLHSFANGLALAPDGALYATGYFEGMVQSADGSTLVSNGSNDVYVLKFAPPPPSAPTVASLTDSPDPVVQGNTLTLTANGVTDVDGSVDSVAFYRDVDANGLLDEIIDQLLGIDNSSTGGWSASVPASFALGAQTYFAVATDNSGLTSQTAATTGQVAAPPVGNVNDMYVWDIGVEQRKRGGKQEARFQVAIRRDSDASGGASGTDALVANATLTVVLRNRTTHAVVGSSTGTTSSNGTFTTAWFSNLAPGGEYYAEVSLLTHAIYAWNGNLDPTPNDGDVDNDGLPDQLFVIP